MKKSEKLKKLIEQLQPFVDEFKNSKEKPLYYKNWVKRLIYFKMEAMKFSNR